MLGDIDYKLKPIKPQYFLCKPDRTIIGKISEAFNDSQTEEFNSINELTLSIPYKIEENHKLINNLNADNLKGLYQIKVVKGNKIEWFMIVDEEDVQDDSDSKTIHCMALSHELNKKLITTYEVVSYNATDVFNDILKNTRWSYDYIDTDFKVNYRSFTFTDMTVLDCIFNVAETFNAIITFDTVNRKFSMFKPETYGNNTGDYFSYGKYLKQFNKKTKYDDQITRLIVRLADGLGIQEVNPTGQEYLEDYTYFIYPFQRDVNKNVISSSYWMSDSLCNALLDYDIVIKNNTPLFKNAVRDLDNAKANLPALEAKELEYRTQRTVIRNTTYPALYTNNYDSYFREREFSPVNKSFAINSNYRYIVLGGYAQGLTITANGVSKYFPDNKWKVITKLANLSNITVNSSGSKSGEFGFSILKIDIDEYTSVGNDQELLYKYSDEYIGDLLDDVKNQINVVNNQITSFQNTVKNLQNAMDAKNNFTVQQLDELSYFERPETYENSEIIDPQDGYDGSLKKFKELQVPQLELNIDIVNFLENIESQHDWGKLVLGNFINVKHEPSNSILSARITQINYNYSDRSISLNLSNVKSLNTDDKKIAKLLYDSKATSVIVNTNLEKWDKASIAANYITNKFEQFYNQITDNLEFDVNNTVRIDGEGITITDPNDPLRFLRMTHGKILLTRSGGLRYETAIDAGGIIAEEIYGKILTSQRVEIGDDDGFFLIKGASATISDRCLREVLKMGLLSENPDKFGIVINRYASQSDCSNKTILNRVSITGDEGFIIERNQNGTFNKTFYTSASGDLFMKGNLQVGDGERVFIANQQGISVGASTFGAAPFRVDMFGNAYMTKLTAETAVIKDSQFLAGEIIGSSITLGESPNVIKLFPDIGFWAGADNFEDAPTSIAMDGTAKFRNATFTNGDGVLLINTDTKQIEMNNFDIVGAGAIDTDLLSAQVLTADDGFIADLTANRISTLSAANVGAFSNYIKVENQDVKWVTGKASGSGTPKTLPDGRQLYWVDASKTGRMTTEVTSYPVMVYTMEEKTKMLWSFEGSGDEAIPFVAMGYGDGAGANSGKFIMKKPNGSMDMRYYASNTSAERAIAFLDLGLNIFTSNGEINIRVGESAYVKLASDGTVEFKGVTGFKFITQ